jgi:hypothetical protein
MESKADKIDILIREVSFTEFHQRDGRKCYTKFFSEFGLIKFKGFVNGYTS